MGAAYVVIVVNKSKLEVCEAYAGSTAALGRASALAHYKSIIEQVCLISNPLESKDKNGDPCWVFIDSHDIYIAVHFQQIKVSNSICDNVCGSLFGQIVATITPVKSVALNDPYEDSLPGGWFFDGKPATMKDLKSNPDLIKSIYDLTDAQKWALATARISKSPNFFLDLEYSTFNQSAALGFLKDKCSVGRDIRDEELSVIEGVRANLTISF